MAHITYNGQQHKIPDAEMERITILIKDALVKDEPFPLTVEDDDGDPNVLFISRGVPISVHGWDPPELPQFPEIPEMPRFNLPGA